MRRKIDINDVLENAFYFELHTAVMKSLMSIEKRPGYQKGRNNYHTLSDNEKRVSRIFRLVSSIINTLQDLNLCQILINKLPDKAYASRNRISNLDYIRYHYEVFIHKIHTVSEIMKMISNEILDLGLSHKECSWGKLMTFQKFKNFAGRAIIDRNFKDFSNLITSRHISSHRGIFEDNDIESLNQSYFLFLYSQRNNYPLGEDLQKALSPAYMKYRLGEVKKKKLTELKKYEQKALKDVLSFFKVLSLHTKED